MVSSGGAEASEEAEPGQTELRGGPEERLRGRRGAAVPDREGQGPAELDQDYFYSQQLTW